MLYHIHIVLINHDYLLPDIDYRVHFEMQLVLHLGNDRIIYVIHIIYDFIVEIFFVNKDSEWLRRYGERCKTALSACMPKAKAMFHPVLRQKRGWVISRREDGGSLRLRSTLSACSAQRPRHNHKNKTHSLAQWFFICNFLNLHSPPILSRTRHTFHGGIDDDVRGGLEFTWLWEAKQRVLPGMVQGRGNHRLVEEVQGQALA